jgi:hypothetical protein
VGSLDGLERRRLFAALHCLCDHPGIACRMLLLPCQRALDGFSGLDAGSAHQLCRQVGVLSTQRIVCPFMQFHAVAALVFKAFLCNRIKARLCSRNVRCKTYACSDVGFVCRISVLSIQKVSHLYKHLSMKRPTLSKVHGIPLSRRAYFFFFIK